MVELELSSTCATKWIWAALSTFGTITQSSASPAPATTPSRSSRHQGVPTTLIRTARVCGHPLTAQRVDDQLPGRIVLPSGATASSRSRNTWSAGSVAAFRSIFSLEPGTARHERRTRVPSRSGSHDCERYRNRFLPATGRSATVPCTGFPQRESVCVESMARLYVGERSRCSETSAWRVYEPNSRGGGRL